MKKFRIPASLPITTHPMYVYAHRAALQEMAKCMDEYAAAAAAFVCSQVWARDSKEEPGADVNLRLCEAQDKFIMQVHTAAWSAANPE